MKLEDIITKYGVPDPSIVGKLPRGGIQLDFVGHAEITRILIDIDPMWNWSPVEIVNGRPAINEANGMATMWGNLTILGKTMIGVGSVRADKPDLDKELIGDFLRNASMRFGICLSLWSKSEWEEHPAPARPKAAPMESAGLLPRFIEACAKANIVPSEVASRAGVDLLKLTDSDMPKLRDIFKSMQEQAKVAIPAPEDMAELIKKEFDATVVNSQEHKIVIKDPTAKASSPQIGKIRALFQGVGISDRGQQHDAAAEIIMRHVQSFDSLNKLEASQIIEVLSGR